MRKNRLLVHIMLGLHRFVGHSGAARAHGLVLTLAHALGSSTLQNKPKMSPRPNGPGIFNADPGPGLNANRFRDARILEPQPCRGLGLHAIEFTRNLKAAR